MIALIPIAWRIGATIALVAVVLGCFAAIRQHYINIGWDNAIKKVEVQNDQAKEAARKAQRGVDECYDANGLWNLATGKCDGR